MECKGVSDVKSELTQILHLSSMCVYNNIDGLVPDCSKSSALALELLQSCTEPSIIMSMA